VCARLAHWAAVRGPLNSYVRRHVNESRIFHALPISYVALCSPWLFLLILLLLFGDRTDPTYIRVLLIFIGIPAIFAAWLAYFRLRVDDHGVEYRDLFGRNFKIAYSDVISLKSHVESGRFMAIVWILHLRDGRRLRLNLKPFSRDVYGLLCEHIRCDA